LPTNENQKLIYGLANIVVSAALVEALVFLSDGSVVGVLVQSMSFPIDLENLSWGRYFLPLVSPLYEIREEIGRLLTEPGILPLRRIKRYARLDEISTWA
jgi:hypothetical protein